MKIDEYKKISDNVQVPDVVWEGYQNAIKQIKMEKQFHIDGSIEVQNELKKLLGDIAIEFINP